MDSQKHARRKRELPDPRLYRRGRYIWARVRDEWGKIDRVTTRCTDPKAAALFADEYERRAADPAYRRSAETTLADAILDWITELRRRKVSDATELIARQKSGHFVRLWGADWPLQRVTNDLVLGYIDTRLGEGVVRYTVKKELGALKGFLEWARFRGTFPYELSTVIPPRFAGQHKPRSRAPTRDEVLKLISALEVGRGAHIAFIAGTGARWSESLRAEHTDVDLVEQRVRLRGTKTKASDEYVPITGVTWSFIQHALTHASKSGRMFRPWNNDSRDIKAACKRSGIDTCTPNDLRRAFGTWHRQALIAGGVNEKSSAEIVSVLLRHTTDTLAQTTYARLSSRDVGPSIRAILPVPDLYPQPAPTASTEPNEHPK